MLYMSLEKVRRVMQKNRIDALVATTAADFCYTSGYHLKGDFLPGATIIPADPALEPVMIVSKYEEKMARKPFNFKDIRAYPSWLEIVDVEDMTEGKLTRVPKLYHHDPEVLCTLLSDTLKEKGLYEGTIGIRMSSTTHRIYSILVEQNPKAKFVDAEETVQEIQRVKTEDGVTALRAAATIGAKGIQGMIEGGVLGATIGELQLKYRKAIFQQITKDNVLRLTVGRGISIIAGDPLTSLGTVTYKVSQGDNLFIDCGIVFDGHVSDMGRTFVVGKPSTLQKKIYKALRAGFEEGLSRMKPGVKMNEIYNAAQDTIRKSGLDWYTRGHLGHSIGMYPPGEQPPFICAQDDTELEPNMVMCLETPLYVNGLGAFQIEDMILITPHGHEVLTELPRDMLDLTTISIPKKRSNNFRPSIKAGD